MKKPIPYSRHCIDQDDIDSVIEVLKSDFLTQGPKISEFEEEFARYIGCNYAVAVSSGTAALHLSAISMGVRPGDKVITTPITFAATANCVRYCGGEVDFVDIDSESFLIDINKLEEKLSVHTPGTYKGIIPVDFTGLPVNTEKIREIADRYGLWIIEDACHAPGGYYIDSKGNTVKCGDGRYADLSIFSFHPVKHIATGEGGMITTNNKDLYEKLIMLRTHGITRDPEILLENHGGWYYEMQELGYNYRLTDLSAALGRSQLSKANMGIKRRNEIAAQYIIAFKNCNLKLQNYDNDYFHAYHLFVILTDRRKEMYDYLKGENIFCQVHYIPVHLHPYYKQLGWKPGDFPLSENYYNKCISLPMYPGLSRKNQENVINKIKKFLNA